MFRVYLFKISGFLLLLFHFFELSTALDTYIVVLADQPYIIEAKSNANLRKSSEATAWRRIQALHHDEILSSVQSEERGVEKLYSYSNIINGFSARLTKPQAKLLRGRKDVLAVAKATFYRPSLTYTPTFLDTIGNHYGQMYSSSTGKDIIIGIIDTGIWPESPYFKDDKLGPVPKRFKGGCMNFTSSLPFNCSRKIVGAKYFIKGFLSTKQSNVTFEVSPRDSFGHGTSSASIAAGNRISRTSIDGAQFGSSNGIAFNSRLSIYKVCWSDNGDEVCSTVDIVAAMDQGVKDKVDLFSGSLGGANPMYYKDDPLYLATLNAVVAGIPVVLSAGNSGQYKVANGYPWVLTVGASTIDRAFQNTILLGNYMSLNGITSTGGTGDPYRFIPLVESIAVSNLTTDFYGTNADFCISGSLNSTLVRGKIVLCKDAMNSKVQKSQAVKEAGGVGVIIYSQSSLQGSIGVDLNNYYLPTSYVTNSVGIYIRDYIRKSKNPKASLSGIKAIFGKKVASAPTISSFSATGPNYPCPYIIKPDIVAPGENIITAWSGSPEANILSNGKPTSFRIVSGTSVSAPHVAGAVAMIKEAHPTWLPSWIYSAIITTGWLYDNMNRPINDSMGLNAIPLQMGGGHLNIEGALDPGLIFPMNASDYLRFQCTDSGGYNPRNPQGCLTKYNEADFNFPYLAIPDLRQNFTTTRTMTLVAWPAIYRAEIVQPAGATIIVSPMALDFSRKKTWSFNITVVPLIPYYSVNVPYDLTFEYTFGRIFWTDYFHRIQMNVAVSIVLID